MPGRGIFFPLWFVLTLLSVALILIPGALVTASRSAFMVVFSFTIVAFVASIGLAIVIALQQLGVVGPWEELRQIARAFLWEITDLETYYLPWMVAIISAGFFHRLIQRWTLIPAAMIAETACYLFFASLPIVLIVWLFGETIIIRKPGGTSYPILCFLSRCL